MDIDSEECGSVIHTFAVFFLMFSIPPDPSGLFISFCFLEREQIPSRCAVLSFEHHFLFSTIPQRRFLLTVLLYISQSEESPIQYFPSGFPSERHQQLVRNFRASFVALLGRYTTLSKENN